MGWGGRKMESEDGHKKHRRSDGYSIESTWEVKNMDLDIDHDKKVEEFLVESPVWKIVLTLLLATFIVWGIIFLALYFMFRGLMWMDGGYAHFWFTEEQLSLILFHLPKEHYLLRKYLQDGGRNMFGWNRWLIAKNQNTKKNVLCAVNTFPATTVDTTTATIAGKEHTHLRVPVTDSVLNCLDRWKQSQVVRVIRIYNGSTSY